MCLIIHKEPNKGKLSDVYQLIENAYTSNHDGYGIAIKKTLPHEHLDVIRGLDGPAVIMNHIKDTATENDEVTVHLRQSTGGRINIINCHPVAMDKILIKESWSEIESENVPLLFHNGVFWSIYGSEFSDTIEFTEKLMNFINWNIDKINSKDILDDIFKNSTLSTHCIGSRIMIVSPLANIPTYFYGQWHKHNELYLSNPFHIQSYSHKSVYAQTKIGYSQCNTPIVPFSSWTRKSPKPSMSDDIFKMDIDSEELNKYLLSNVKEKSDNSNIENDSILFDPKFDEYFIFKKNYHNVSYTPLTSVESMYLQYKSQEEINEMIVVNINKKKESDIDQKMKNDGFLEKMQLEYNKLIVQGQYNRNIKVHGLKINILHAGYVIAHESYESRSKLTQNTGTHKRDYSDTYDYH